MQHALGATTASLERVAYGVQQVATRERIRVGRHLAGCALGHHAAPALAGARADVDDVVGAADGVLVVFHHHQGVALVAQFVQGIQQDLVVTRVQADGGFVQHVAHALQIGAQLRRQTDPLRLATRERGCTAIEREIAQAHFLQKLQPALDLRDQVTCDALLASG